jgi:NAD/NADP transhydrogenase alpha subunit
MILLVFSGIFATALIAFGLKYGRQVRQRQLDAAEKEALSKEVDMVEDEEEEDDDEGLTDEEKEYKKKERQLYPWYPSYLRKHMYVAIGIIIGFTKAF